MIDCSDFTAVAFDAPFEMWTTRQVTELMVPRYSNDGKADAVTAVDAADRQLLQALAAGDLRAYVQPEAGTHFYSVPASLWTYERALQFLFTLSPSILDDLTIPAQFIDAQVTILARDARRWAGSLGSMRQSKPRLPDKALKAWIDSLTKDQLKLPIRQFDKLVAEQFPGHHVGRERARAMFREPRGYVPRGRRSMCRKVLAQ
jgi:hypothetical protein